MPDRVRHRLRRFPLPWADVALALGFTIVAVVWLIRSTHADGVQVGPVRPGKFLTQDGMLVLPVRHPAVSGKDILVNLMATLPVAFRRRFPYSSFLIAIGGIIVLRADLVWPGFLGIMICAYSAVAHGRKARTAIAMLGVAAIIAASEFSNSIPPIPGGLGPFLIFTPIGLAAATIRHARARADAGFRRAAALEQERAATARAAIAEERARIARELHDVVSHHVSVMVIQASAARQVIDARPDLAGNALTAIESSGREAMAELRHLLGLVAPVDDRLHPQPGIDDIDALVDAVRSAGQPVTLHRDVPAVPPGIGLTIYRVAQEGLTNALRYAPGAPTTVTLRRGDADLLVEVTNDAPTPAAVVATGTGSGLVGLAERLRLHDGTFNAGRRADGGFRIVARIPAAQVPAPASGAGMAVEPA